MPDVGYSPIYTAGFFAGLWTQRNLLRDPSSTWQPNKRMDVLFDGLNVEISNNLTIQRAVGTYPYSSVLFSEQVDGFYSFSRATQTETALSVMVDTPSEVSVLTPSTKTSIQTKSSGAGKTRFESVGNILYLGNGKDQKAYQPSDPRFATSVRNWGIALTGADASDYAGLAAQASESAGTGVAAANTTVNDAPNSDTSHWFSGSFLYGSGSAAWATYPNGGEHYLQPFSTTTEEIQFTGFDFSGIPDTANIDGVVVQITRDVGHFSNLGYSDPTVRDDEVKLLPSGTDNKAAGDYYPVGLLNNTGPPPVIDSFNPGQKTYGSVTDTWGFAGIAPSDVKAATFGVAVKVTSDGVVDVGDIWACRVFTVSVTVYYSLAAPGNAWSNLAFAQGAPDGSFATAAISSSVLGNVPTKILTLTSYSGISLSNVKILGITVTVTDRYVISTGGFARIEATLLANGAKIGTTKTYLTADQTSETVVLGDSSDLWGTTNLSAEQVSDTEFGVQLIGRLTTGTDQSGTFGVDAVQITIHYIDITDASTGGVGALTGTFKYVYEYVNTAAGSASIATPQSDSVVLANQEADIVLVASPDPQVNEIWVFRTTTGGGTFYRLPNTFPNTSQTVHDDNPDDSLITQLQADLTGLNTVPPIGATNTAYFAQRLWVSVLNVVYYSSGASLGFVFGNGNEGFPPANVFTFPATVHRLVPTTIGLLVFTASGLYIIKGNLSISELVANASGIPFYQDTLLPKISLLSYDALTVNGSIMYLMTGDRQTTALDPSVGVSNIGFPIAAPPSGYAQGEVATLKDFSPTASYLAWHVSGENQALYVANGGDGWFRCNTSQVPEGAFIWSAKREIASQAINAIADVETSGGVHQLLIGPGSGGGYVMALNEGQGAQITATALTSNVATYTAINEFVVGQRVNVYGCSRSIFNQLDALVTAATSTTFSLSTTAGDLASVSETTASAIASCSDNGVNYDATATIGAIVLAQPGTIAKVGFFTADFTRVGSSPAFSVLMEEIKGTFEDISAYVHADPPTLYGDTSHPSSTYSNRYELMQTVEGNDQTVPAPAWCRYLSARIDFGSVDTDQNELLSLTVYGGLYAETL